MGQPQKRKATQRIDPNSAVSALILMSAPRQPIFCGDRSDTQSVWQ